MGLSIIKNNNKVKPQTYAQHKTEPKSDTTTPILEYETTHV